MRIIVIPVTIFSFLLLTISSFSQLPAVDVAELTIKVGGMETKELYYGFAEGDQIIFNFEELKGKPLKEIEISELPSNSKFMDFKSKKIENKKINVLQKAVYLFKFTNTAIGGRICKMKIQRIPKTNDLVNFNTNWKWKTLYDTTYVPFTKDSIVGYDTTYLQKTRKKLISTDTVPVELFNKNERVHSCMYGEIILCDPANARSHIRVPLPKNEVTPYRTKKVISWAYYLGVGEATSNTFAQNKQKFLTDVTEKVASKNLMYGLAVGAVSYMILPTSGDNVYYYFVRNYDYVLAFHKGLGFLQFDQGDGPSAYGRNTEITQGEFYICLYNDNEWKHIDVMVKVTAVYIDKKYVDEQYTEQRITPRKVTLHKRRMVVNTTQIRVNDH